MRVGNRGLVVREWQDLMNRAFTGGTVDHPALTVDGGYGPATASATRAVQAAAGIAQDGVVGPATRGALPGLLPGASSAAPSVSERRLSSGALGGDVIDWQQVVGGLVASGEVDTPRLALDGVFGPATKAGIVAVQKRLSITSDGIVGRVTRALRLGPVGPVLSQGTTCVDRAWSGHTRGGPYGPWSRGVACPPKATSRRSRHSAPP